MSTTIIGPGEIIFGLLLIIGMLGIFLRGKSKANIEPISLPPGFAKTLAGIERLNTIAQLENYSEDKLHKELLDLMVHDTQGYWWMVGYRSGDWYRHDGHQWVKRRPPRLQQD